VDEPAMQQGPHTTLYESWAPNHPFTGIFERAFVAQNDWGEWTWTQSKNRGYGRGMRSAFNVRDFGVDVPFQYGNGTGRVREAFIEDDAGDGPRADWPRASAIQKVESEEFGTRYYAILVDASGVFYVFPLSSIGPVDGYTQNVDQSVVQRVKPEYPDWVFRYDGTLRQLDADRGRDNSFVLAPDMDWKFTKDGKKACLVAIEREKAAFDYSFQKPTGYLFQGPFDDGLPTGLGAQLAAFGHPARFGRTQGDSQGSDYWYHCAPGLIEAAVNIEIIGEDKDQFRVVVELTVVRRPTETPFCTLLAGYCWQDIKAPDWTAEDPKFLAKEGDLCVLDCERWWN